MIFLKEKKQGALSRLFKRKAANPSPDAEAETAIVSGVPAEEGASPAPEAPQAEPDKRGLFQRKKDDIKDQLSARKKKVKKPKDRRFIVPRRHWLARLLVIAVVVLAGKLYYDTLTDMSYFDTTFYIIDDEKIDNQMRIILLSDLHLNEFGENNIDLVNHIADLKPDIIAIAGDMMNETNPDDSVVITLCRQLVEIAPVYYAYGNHEGYVIRVAQTSDLNERLLNLGVHVMHNDYETITVNGNVIDIGCLDAGIDYFYESYVTRFWNRYKKAENYHLLIVHYPNYFMEGAPLQYGEDVDLALCGHLHGGQIVIPGIGGLYHPSTGFFPELASGVNYVGTAKVVVSRGLGGHGTIPRINNPPELVVVDLK